MATLKNKTPIPYKSPFIEDGNFLATGNNAYLKLPATPNTKSEQGIYVKMGYHYKGLFKIGDVSNGAETIFDNQTVGIKVIDADVRINNCTFQHTLGSNPNTETFGILAEHYDEGNFNIITTPTNANRNLFVDCKYGIVSNYFTHAIIEGNTIISSKTAPLASVQEGREGITVRTSTVTNNLATLYNNEVMIKSNRIINVAYGISVNYDDFPWNMNPAYPLIGQVYNPSLLNKIEIYNNEMDIRLDPLNTPMPNPNFFIDQAITCNVNIAVGPPTSIHSPLRLYQNSLQLVNNGILCSNWNSKDIRAIENEINLYDGNIGFAPTTSQYALRFDAGASQLNNLVYANTFNSLAGTKNTIMKEGVFLLNSNIYTMKCNTSASLNSHYLFNGTLTPSVFQINNLSAQNFSGLSQKGLHLAQNGAIGTQGSGGAASDNLFSPFMPTNITWQSNSSFMAYCSNSNATLSKLFVRKNNNLYDVGLSSGKFGNSVLHQWTNSNTLENGAVTSRACPDQQPRYMVIPVGGEVKEITLPQYRDFDFSTEASIIALNAEETHIKLDEMVALAQGNTLQNNLSEGELRLYVQQMQLYSFLISPNGVKEQRGDLQEWVNVRKAGSFGIIYNISVAIAANNFSDAQNSLSNWNKVNRVDENYAAYFELKIKLMQNQSIDMGKLEDMCLKCPLTDGSVVIAAQCLYNSLTNAHRLFDNSCGIDYGEYARGIAQNNTITSTPNLDVATIYPNPAKNYINVLASDMQQAMLTDITGKQLQIQKARANTVTFSTNNLLPGLYFIKITHCDGSVKTQKFVKQ